MADGPRAPRLRPRTWSLLGAGILGVIGIAFLRGVFLTLLVAVVIAYILDPIVSALSRIRLGARLVPRWVCVVVLYLVLFGGIGVSGRLVLPRLASEITVLAAEAPAAFQRARREWIPAVERGIRDRLRPYLPPDEPADAERAHGVRITKARNGAMDVDLGSMEMEVRQVAEGRWRIRPVPAGPRDFDLGRAVAEAARGALSTGQGETLNVLSLGRAIVQGTIAAIFGILVTMMIAAYLLADKERIIGFVRVLFPPRLRPSWEQLLVKLERGLAGVLRGQLIICLVNGTFSGIGFWWLDLPYWPLLTAIATVLSIIPVFGAIISSLPAIALALTVSWKVALATLAWILGVHALEAYFLNPKIIGTSARIHPVLVLSALVAGERSYGIVGALLAVPFASIGQTIFVYLRNRAYHEETEPPPDGDSSFSDPGPTPRVHRMTAADDDARPSPGRAPCGLLRVPEVRVVGPRSAPAWIWPCLVALAAFLPALASCDATDGPANVIPTADVVVYGGSVWGPEGPIAGATAVAVRGGTVLAVGSEADVGAHEGRATEVVRVPGGAILPGLVDAHGHLHGLGVAMETLDLVGTTSAEAVVEKVREADRAAAPGDWITGRGWDQNDWRRQAFPDRALLDAVSTRPVYLRRVDGHAAWVSSSVLALAGIDASTPDPEGGRILRRADGSPTGVLVDAAVERVVAVQPKPDARTIERRVLAAAAHLVSVGLTGFHDMGEPPEVVDVLRALDREGRLPIRLHVYLEGGEPRTTALLAEGPRPAEAGSLLAIVGVKYYLDGALGSRGAALLEPYADEPETSGLLLTTQDGLATLASDATAKGFQIAVHAIGDRANRIALDVLARLAKRAPLPPRIEHAQIVSPEDLARFGRDGIVASMQPTHCTSDSPWAGARLGRARERGAYAWRSISRGGALLAFGSDVPVEDPDPRLGLVAAVTRGGWHVEEALTMAESVRAFTDGAAKAVGEGDRRGRIAVGMDADLSVFDGPIGTPEEASAARVALTVVAGRIVYGR